MARPLALVDLALPALGLLSHSASFHCSLQDIDKLTWSANDSFVNPRQKALALLLLREMEEELDDAGAVDVQVSLEVHDRAIPVMPEFLVVMGCVQEPFAAKNVAMHSDDQYFLVIGSVKNANPPAFGQIASGAPKKVVFQFGRTGMFEAEHLATLRVDARHHVPDGTVLSCRIHRLKD